MNGSSQVLQALSGAPPRRQRIEVLDTVHSPPHHETKKDARSHDKQHVLQGRVAFHANLTYQHL